MLPAAPLRRGLAYWSAAPSPVPTRPAPSDIGAPPPTPTRDAMAPPDGAAVSDDAMGLTQRELLMEMREDIKGLKATVDVIAKDQALGVERRASMQRSADCIYEPPRRARPRTRPDLRRWRDRADGAMVLARWALGASLISLVAVVCRSSPPSPPRQPAVP